MMLITIADYNRKNALFVFHALSLSRQVNKCCSFLKKNKKEEMFKEEFLKDPVQ